MSEGKTVLAQGRIVWTVGDLFQGRHKTDFNTRQPLYDAKGEPKKEYGFGLAIPKSALTGDVTNIWGALHAEALSLYPSGQIPPAFAMKFKDGDTAIDDKGFKYSDREGYAGCIVVSCTTSLPIKWFRFENGTNTMINEGVKCGDYVNVQLSIKAHPAQGAGKAGLYVNPNAVQFLGYGPAIINTPAGDDFFGKAAPAMPAGASAMPLAPQPGQMLVPPAAAPVMAPAPVAAPVAHHYGVLPTVHQPAVAPAMPSMNAAPVPTGFPPIPR